MKEKLTSRKFWFAAAGFIAGLVPLFTSTDDPILVRIGLILSIVSGAIYMIVEGSIDAGRSPE